jgi:hypothetical protein
MVWQHGVAQGKWGHNLRPGQDMGKGFRARVLGFTLTHERCCICAL